MNKWTGFRSTAGRLLTTSFRSYLKEILCNELTTSEGSRRELTVEWEQRKGDKATLQRKYAFEERRDYTHGK